MKIQVTKEHIKNGVCSSPTKCMVALAISDVVHKDVKVSVPCPYVALDHMSWIFLALPDEVISAIRKFDKQSEIEPFEFELEIPQEYLNVY